MMTLIAAGLQALFAEVAFVAVLTGILYVYWKAMTKSK